MNGFTWALLGAALLLLGLNAWRRRGVVSVTAGDIQRRLESGEKLVIVDVREPGEFRSGHIPGAVSAPLSRLDTEAARLKPDTEIVLVCASGSRSISAYHLLKHRGFQRLLNLSGGMGAWRGQVKHATK